MFMLNTRLLEYSEFTIYKPYAIMYMYHIHVAVNQSFCDILHN